MKKPNQSKVVVRKHKTFHKKMTQAKVDKKAVRQLIQENSELKARLARLECGVTNNKR